MNGLDLFSGIGGITKALEGYVKPVAYCENDRYAQAVLLSRMRAGDIPTAPIWDDVRTLHASELPVTPDIIYGGFPCQDISIAGRGAGLAGSRSGLFFQIVRLVREIRPSFVFLENVPNIRTRGLGRVLKELDSLGYDCRWGLLSAAEVGANHKRKRWFLLAHSQGEQNWRICESGIFSDTRTGSWWDVEPEVGRVAHGVPFRVDRLRGLGNAVVPAQAREAFERLMGLK